jgi:hypothetical protein
MAVLRLSKSNLRDNVNGRVENLIILLDNFLYDFHSEDYHVIDIDSVIENLGAVNSIVEHLRVLEE